MFNKKSINCDVSSCDYNDYKEGKCTLDKVKISCSCNKNQCFDTSSTVCESFTSSGGIITDNEYEILSELEYEKETYI